MSRRKRQSRDRSSDAGAASPRWAVSGRRLGLIAVAALSLILVAVAIVVVRFQLTPDGGPTPPRAAIIDELGITNPNPALLEQSRQSLVNAGYVVDIYQSDQVSVDLFRRLPSLGYALVIVRGHSAGQTARTDPNTHAPVEQQQVSLFTSEPYSKERYVDDQRALRLNIVQIAHSYVEGQFGAGVEVTDPPNDRYFGITPAFMEQASKGRFKGTVVLLMGCDAVNSNGMAEAFINKGARAVAGWDGQVSVEHTDAALSPMLRHLLVDELDPGAAVAATMNEIGPDPAFGAKFVAY